MMYCYTGLSAQQVTENRQRFGENIITPNVSIHMIEKLRQVSTYWLIRILLIIELTACFVLLALDIFLSDLPLLAGVILLLLAGVIVLAYFVAYMVGHWNVRHHHQEVGRMITILMICLVVACCIVYYRIMIAKEIGLYYYLGLVTIAVIIIGVTTITYLWERRVIHRHLLGGNESKASVIRDGETLCILVRDIVVGDIVLLKSGDDVPADVELLEGSNLIVDESALMGSCLCRKSTTSLEENSNTIIPIDQVMKGSVVLEGEAIAEVFAVGNSTMAANIETHNSQWQLFECHNKHFSLT